VRTYFTTSPKEDYLDAALITILQIHTEQPPGGVLVFLTGMDLFLSPFPFSACSLLGRRKMLNIMKIENTGQEEIETLEKQLLELAPNFPSRCQKVGSFTLMHEGIAYYFLIPSFFFFPVSGVLWNYSFWSVHFMLRCHHSCSCERSRPKPAIPARLFSRPTLPKLVLPFLG
jgi:hypothetical protein